MSRLTKITTVQEKAKARALQESKLAIQGVISRYKSVRQGQERKNSGSRRRPIVEIDAVEELHRNVKAVLLRARSKLAPDQYDEFLRYAFRAIPDAPSSPRNYYFVQGYQKAPAIALDNEVRWVVAWLNQHEDVIENHVARVARIDHLVLHGQFAEALKELDKHIDQHGHTLWAIQLALALEQRTGGLEAQKRRHEQLRRRNKRGLLAYISYMTSVRNEDRATLSQFRADLEEKTAALRPRALGRYALYRLGGAWPADTSGIADVLRVEQSNGPVDVFETIINLIQTCIRDPEKRWLLPQACRAMRPLKANDFRIDKALLHAGESPRWPLKLLRSPTLSDALLEGRLADALHNSRARQQRVDPWSVIYRALAAAHTSDLRRPLRPTPVRSLAIVAGQANDSNSYSAEFLKQSFNLANIPSQQALLDFADQLRTEGHEEPFRFSLPSLNCIHLGPEDLTDTTKDQATIKRLEAAFNGTSTLAFWRHDGQSGARLLPEVSDFSNAVVLERRNDRIEAISVIAPHVTHNPSSLLRRLSAALLLSSLTLQQDKKRIIELIADEAARPDASLDRLPIAPAMRLVDFSDTKLLGGSLAAIVFLDVQQKLSEDDVAASRLRFATKAFLRRTPKKKPSQMLDDGNSYPERLLIYFLRYVCIPSVIDVSLIFKTSAEVIEERQAVCAVLTSIDAKNKELYQTEFLSLEHSSRIAVGLQLINKNRVHVDIDAIVRAFVRGGNELFQRYQDLTRAGIGVSDSYDQVLREIMTAVRHARPMVFTPDNEADAALVQLVLRAREEFLHSATGGLDFFLSKRIRHQSFVGLVRGPLEFENLITARETATSAYRANDYWLSQFSALPENKRSMVSEAFARFAGSFDEAILSVKDQLFHVKAYEHPLGIFDIQLTHAMMLVVRSVAKSIETSEEFVRAMVAIFWALVDPNLANARRIIREDLKMKVATLIDGLRTAVGGAAGGTAAAVAFSLAVGRASSQVQLALTEAESWFNRPEVVQAVQLFTLEEAVDIAIESARKLNRTFTPAIATNVRGGLSLAVGDLVFITDAVLIAFSNIRAYSGVRAPRVSVECFVDKGQETLVLNITNEVSPRSRSSEQDAKLQTIRDQIAQNAVGKLAKKEGGSGFFKLASVVRQSPKGKLEFGFISDTEFRLSVVWSLILTSGGYGDADVAG